MSSVINWFDIPAIDLERAIKFYETTLGIKLIAENMLGAQMAIFPAPPGETTGALMAREGVSCDCKPKRSLPMCHAFAVTGDSAKKSRQCLLN